MPSDSSPSQPLAASDPTAVQGRVDALERRMSKRHLMMISFGGVIGTGLFLSTGYTINQAGPFGTVLAYSIGAVIVYLVMMCLGELSVAMPFTGAFHVYARRFIGPATGFVTAVLYWLTWTVALGSEFTGAAIIMNGWFPGVPVWVWAALFIALVLVLNMLSVRVFAEAETLLSGVKVVAIILFIVLGAAAVVGLLPYDGGGAGSSGDGGSGGAGGSAPLLSNLTGDGLFPNGLGAVFTTILAVNFAFSGTELIGITAGEVKDPGATIPRAIRATLARLVVFFIGSIVIIAALIPWEDAGVEESPFVTVLDGIGIPGAGDIMNVVILTAILSAANSGLYASTRMLWSLANEGTLPRVLARTNRFGVPALAMGLSMIGGLAALLTSVYAASTVYLVLVSVSGLAVVLVWVAISASHLSFRRHWEAEGHDAGELAYRAPAYPWVPIAALVLTTASCLLIVFDPVQRPALGITAAFLAVCYGGYWAVARRVSL